MDREDKILTKYIPDYLEHCRTHGLSLNTLKNYVRFLDSFSDWLKINKLEDLTPRAFTTDYVKRYHAWLSQRPNKTKKDTGVSLSTQTRYLVVLRNFFAYLLERRIDVGIFPQEVKLPKLSKSSLGYSPIDMATIQNLCELPDASTVYGLRDRVLLGILLATGLKVSQMVNLNREDVSQKQSGIELILKRVNPLPNSHAISLPPKLGVELKNYCAKRTDKESALFIRTSGPTNAPARITVRSVERIVKKYAAQLGIVTSTPELLRGAYNKSILAGQKQLKNYGFHHQSVIQNRYGTLAIVDNRRLKKELSWHDGEQIISSEVVWLKNYVLTMPPTYRGRVFFETKCDDCVLRSMASLIVSGEIRAIHITAKPTEKDLWNSLTQSDQLSRASRHGKEWHRKMIDVVVEYFNGCEQVSEPTIHYGRADLGVVQKSGISIYVEVGTVSLFKLWYNLSVMKDTVFLIVPDENYVIEFRT